MHGPRGRTTRYLRSLAFGLAAVAVVAVVGWTIEGAEPPRLEEPVVTAPVDLAFPSSPDLPAGPAISEVPAFGAIDIRNELEAVAAITIVGAGPMPMTARRGEAPKIRAVVSGEISVDVHDASNGQVLVRQAVLRLPPDEVTTLLVRRDTSGTVVLLVTP